MTAGEYQVSFMDYLPQILELAKDAGMGKTRFCEVAGITNTRLAQFISGKKNFTQYYFMKAIGGLGYDMPQFEKAIGRKLTPEQKEAVRVMNFPRYHYDLVRKLLNNPKLLKKVYKITEEEK